MNVIIIKMLISPGSNADFGLNVLKDSTANILILKLYANGEYNANDLHVCTHIKINEKSHNLIFSNVLI